MDILSQAPVADGAAKMEVRDAHGVPMLKEDGTPITITLLGKDSDVWIKAENTASNRRLAQGLRAKLTAEGLRADAISALARVTVAWDGIGLGEPETPCTYENAVKLYTAVPAIREQVDEFIADRGNFTMASQAT